MTRGQVLSVSVSVSSGNTAAEPPARGRAVARVLALAVGTAALAGAIAGCRENPPPKKTASDREVLQEVNGAVNEVIRSLPDCDTARPLIARAAGKIEWAKGQLELPASRPTLDALAAQLERAKQVCP